jgi:hypothetical protein
MRSVWPVSEELQSARRRFGADLETIETCLNNMAGAHSAEGAEYRPQPRGIASLQGNLLPTVGAERTAGA